MRRGLIAALGVVALAIPSAALAGQGENHGHGNASGHSVTDHAAYVFRGTYEGGGTVKVATAMPASARTALSARPSASISRGRGSPSPTATATARPTSTTSRSATRSWSRRCCRRAIREHAVRGLAPDRPDAPDRIDRRTAREGRARRPAFVASSAPHGAHGGSFTASSRSSGVRRRRFSVGRPGTRSSASSRCSQSRSRSRSAIRSATSAATPRRFGGCPQRSRGAMNRLVLCGLSGLFSPWRVSTEDDRSWPQRAPQHRPADVVAVALDVVAGSAAIGIRPAGPSRVGEQLA